MPRFYEMVQQPARPVRDDLSCAFSIDSHGGVSEHGGLQPGFYNVKRRRDDGAAHAPQPSKQTTTLELVPSS